MSAAGNVQKSLRVIRYRRQGTGMSVRVEGGVRGGVVRLVSKGEHPFKRMRNICIT